MLKLKLQYFGYLMQKAGFCILDLGKGYWKRSWCWERLKAGGKGGDRGWDDWMASPTQWPWIWASSGRWWWTGKPGVLWSMGSQSTGHTLVAEQQHLNFILFPWSFCHQLHQLPSPQEHNHVVLLIQRTFLPFSHCWICYRRILMIINEETLSF